MAIRLKIAFGAIAGLIVTGIASAAAPKATFESLDKNSDGKVSVHEASDHEGLFVAFKDLDTNKDGDLSREEFASYKGK